ncbi:MAG: orotate phosphoribosyltransferase [Candidatus Hodarchaeota archaeon]
MNWQKEKFYDFIIENNVIGFFKEPLKLKSGRLSYWYVNWRNVAEDVYLIDKLSNFLISFVKELNLNPDCFYGVPEGATKLGIITQYKWAKGQLNYKMGAYSLSMGRAKPKDHGDPKDKYFLGNLKGNVIIIEDVTTTGGSLLETIKFLSEIDIKIIAAIGLTNRNEIRDDNKSVEEIIEENDIKYYAMSNAIDLLPIAFKKLKPGRKISEQIEEYFKKYGIKEIKL